MQRLFSKKILAIATLCFVSPLLIELQSGNIPLLQYLSPGMFIFLVTIGYGFPVLLIREIAVRFNLGIPSILLLGFVYGIYNEGFFARTLLRDTGLPIPTFDGQFLVFGVSLAFLVAIVTAHALQAVLYAITVSHVMYKDVRHQPWLSKKLSLSLGGILFTVGTLAFFRAEDGGLGSVPSYFFLIFISFVFVVSAWIFRRHGHLRENISVKTRPNLLAGSLLVLPLILPAVISVYTSNPFWPITIWLITVVFIYRFIKSRFGFSSQTVLLLGTGHLFTGMLISLPLVFFGNPDPIGILVGYVVVSGLLIWFYYKVLRKSIKAQ